MNASCLAPRLARVRTSVRAHRGPGPGISASFLLLVVVLLVRGAGAEPSTLAALAPELPALHGVVLERTWNVVASDGYDRAAALDELERLARRGAGAVALDVIGLVARPDSPFVEAAEPDLEREYERLARLAVRARALGMRVVLRARLAVQQGDPSSTIGAADERSWPKWFTEYRRWLSGNARLAERIEADVFVIGVSLGGTTAQTAQWRETIAEVRQLYRGALTYGADAGDEIERIAFWDDLDLVGAELFPALERAGDRDPTPRPRPSVWSADDADSVAVHELVGALEPYRDRFARIVERTARPLLITAVGFRSITAAWRDPRAPLDRFAPSDEHDQRRAVAAVVRALGQQVWLRGMLWWNWEIPHARDATAAQRERGRSFSVRDKLAELEVRRAWAAPPLGWDARRARGRGGVVVSDDSTATEVGLAVLREGGNAADAAVATAFALAVTLPEAGNLGGGGFAVSYDPRRRQTRALDFREQAPLRAHEHTYEELAAEGLVDASTRGPLAAAIPGTVAGLHALWEAEGSLPWERLLRPAFELAAQGFAIGATTAQTLDEERALLRSFASTRALLLPEGRLLREGEMLRQPALAAVLLTLMREGPAAFYRGAIARDLVEGVQEAGGLWTLEDLAAYRVQTRRAVRWPLTGDGRVELVTMGLPSSAGTLLPQIWTFLEHQRAERDAPSSSRRAHAWVEAFRLAFADRNTHLGDPTWMRIDERALVQPQYLRRRARELPPAGVAGSSGQIEAGTPHARGTEPDETTHLVVIDAQGRAVSLTTTLNGLFGCGWVEPRTGILLNNQMDDFDTRPGRPNLYGLIGSEQNRVRPGARMLSSMSPSLVLRDGRTWLVLGGRGGPRIATAVAQILYSRIVDGWPLDRAIGAPRLHHQWWPDEVRLEAGRAWPQLASALEREGYTVSTWAKSGKVHAAEMLGDGRFAGVADPRGRGLARCVDPETVFGSELSPDPDASRREP